MPGITVTKEDLDKIQPTIHPRSADRFAVQRKTIEILANEGQMTAYRSTVVENHAQWKTQAAGAETPRTVKVIAGDWGEVTQARSRATGETYAVLNMANAYHVGGGYLHGAPAQEENMFRRSDCHSYVYAKHVRSEHLQDGRILYIPLLTDLINAQGEHGKVYLDKEHPRVCFRDSEAKGYRFLNLDECFSFYELRSAAVDLRGRTATDADYELMSSKIEAQLLTLIDNGVRHVVLSAFGCGAFENDASVVAQIYQRQLQKYGAYFDDVVFAIYDGLSGPKNLPIFEDVLKNMSLPERKAQPAQAVIDEQMLKLGNIDKYFGKFIKECPNYYKPSSTTKDASKFFSASPQQFFTGFKQIREILANDTRPLELKLQNIRDVCAHPDRKNEPAEYQQHYENITNLLENPTLLENLLLSDWEIVDKTDDEASSGPSTT